VNNESTIFYTVYKVVNNINKRYYIGKHITKNLNDGYMGSGVLILRAIKKYGVHNFSKEYLHFASNEAEMNSIENRLVIPIDQDPNSYNILEGGVSRKPAKMTESGRKRLSEFHKKRIGKPPTTKNRIHVNNGTVSKIIKKSDKIPDGYKVGRLPVKKTSAQKRIDSETRSNKVWYTDGVKNIWIDKGLTPPPGFRSGVARKKTMWINNGIKNMVISREDDIPDGFTVGKTKKKWINNGKESKMIHKDDNIPDGFNLGRGKIK